MRIEDELVWKKGISAACWIILVQDFNCLEVNRSNSWGTWFKLKVLLQARPLVLVQVEMGYNFGLCTCVGEFSGTVLSREFSFSSLAEYLVLRIARSESPTQFTEAACCQEDSVLPGYKGHSSGMARQELRGRVPGEEVGLPALPVTVSAPLLHPDLKASQGPAL